MNILEKKEYFLEKIRKEGCICSWFQHFAMDSWLRIQFARTRSGLRVHETSITQNLVYEFMLYSMINPSHISVFEEASDEPTNGNDIEMILKFKDGSELFLCLQAKLLYKNGKYDQMKSHPEQINSLIKYAYEKDGLPFYLLYNFQDDTGLPQAEQYGCSLINAFHLRNNYYKKKKNSKGENVWIVPNFFNLHPEYAFPWNVLGCNAKSYANAENFVRFLFRGSKNLKDALEYISPDKVETPRSRRVWNRLTLDSFQDEKEQLLFSKSRIRNENNLKKDGLKKTVLFDQIPEIFKPKYRMEVKLD